MFATSTGILMALFLNNGGGAWDNAKKYVESGFLLQKNNFYLKDYFSLKLRQVWWKGQ